MKIKHHDYSVSKLGKYSSLVSNAKLVIDLEVIPHYWVTYVMKQL
jgi:hypothetical protein